MENKERQRKRGDDLINSIFSATKELILDLGYQHITIQMIAQKAETSRAVIYRRWSSIFEILVAIIDFEKNKGGGRIRNRLAYTGDLRKDLIELLTIYDSFFTEIGLEILKAYFYEMGMNKDLSLKDTKNNIFEDNLKIMTKILDIAKQKGEEIKEINEEMLTLPFNIIRINNIFWEDKMTNSKIELIVDTILLPVFKAN